MNCIEHRRFSFAVASVSRMRLPSLRSYVAGAAILFSLGISAVPSHAQDLAEAAKQERARKEEARRKSKHVYTEEDLKRAQILTPEDRAQLEAAKNPVAPAAEDKSATAAITNANNNAEPLQVEPTLGDLARINRKKKELRTLERSAQFPLPFSGEPRLASPRPTPPLAPILPPTVKPASPRPLPPAPVIRRSPFERPRNLYSAPRTVTPALRPLVPGQPKSVSPRATPVPSAPADLTVPIVPAATPNSIAPNSVNPILASKNILVVVGPGDSLWKLAEHHLGRGQRWHELLSANPHLANPNHIRVGEKILIPASELRPTSDLQYRVLPGDTLSGIAASQFHRAAAWSCIAAANPDLADPNRIGTGQLLLLPASCAP